VLFLDWKGNILRNQEWYNDPEEKDKDEPSKDDFWGYIKVKRKEKLYLLTRN
jgi:hypothetical protein